MSNLCSLFRSHLVHGGIQTSDSYQTITINIIRIIIFHRKLFDTAAVTAIININIIITITATKVSDATAEFYCPDIQIQCVFVCYLVDASGSVSGLNNNTIAESTGTSICNSLGSSRESLASLSQRSTSKRKLSVGSHSQGGKIPWCACWGNGCI